MDAVVAARAPHRRNAADSWPDRAEKGYQNGNQIRNRIGNHQAPTGDVRHGPNPTTAQQWHVVARTWHAPVRNAFPNPPASR
jgi:hypothetical protein